MIDLFENKAKEKGKYVSNRKVPSYEVIISFCIFVFKINFIVTLISGLLCVGLKSVKTGLFALIPNILPIFLGSSFLYILDVPLDIGTIIVGSVCLGIAVDDNSFLSTYKHYT